ncbi:AraC family transcriptional regulator [Hyphomicrobium sp.]|uniref:AraC family transcriptional regulator n=1 Tax=Hyphomicrobium sp. TaxID=82 RepID=UPI0025BCECE2|nr:AraC family transcriptional regulator [Hyphomicrobium sp.]MCC7250269.1 helix-turn-helix transcriptional regulator [Hyphomicrobium sp.]
MTFHPRMKSSLKGISVINALHRTWNGIVADVWQVRCQDAEGEYESPDPRLFVALQMRGDGSFNLDAPGAHRVFSSSITYVPAGRFLRSRSYGISYVRHLDLHFDVEALRRQFGAALDEQRLGELRLLFQDEHLLAICQLIAAECMNPDPLHSLYGDSLATALVAKLFEVRKTKGRHRPRLSEQQLRLVMDFMEDNYNEPIRLSEMAALTGLSQIQFSRAFKETVGMPPHARLQEIRVRKVQEFLSVHDWPLTEIATAAGFADQAHLTRVFKRITGLTPAYWARQCALRGK